MYRKSKKGIIEYSYYILALEEGFILKDFEIRNSKFLNVYGVREGEVIIRKYKIGKYQLFLKNRSQFLDKTVDLVTNFMKSVYEIKILVELNIPLNDEYEDRSSFVQNLFMTGIIFISFIILMTLFWLVKLVKKRKKMRLKSYETVMNSRMNSEDELINGNDE